MKLIPAYQLRVLNEQSELQNKIDLLEGFLMDLKETFNLEKEDRELLKQQLFLMISYNNVLKRRIERF